MAEWLPISILDPLLQDFGGIHQPLHVNYETFPWTGHDNFLVYPYQSAIHNDNSIRHYTANAGERKYVT